MILLLWKTEQTTTLEIIHVYKKPVTTVCSVSLSYSIFTHLEKVIRNLNVGSDGKLLSWDQILSNAYFCKYSFIGIQSQPFVYILSVAVAKLSRDRNHTTWKTWNIDCLTLKKKSLLTPLDKDICLLFPCLEIEILKSRNIIYYRALLTNNRSF